MPLQSNRSKAPAIRRAGFAMPVGGGTGAMVTNKRRIRVEWGHCDPAEIVYYPNYFAWFDACTTHLFESVGLTAKRFFKDFGVRGYPLLEASAKFHVASAFGDEIDTATTVSAWRPKTFTLSHRFTRGETLLRA